MFLIYNQSTLPLYLVDDIQILILKDSLCRAFSHTTHSNKKKKGDSKRKKGLKNFWQH